MHWRYTWPHIVETRRLASLRETQGTSWCVERGRRRVVEVEHVPTDWRDLKIAARPFSAAMHLSDVMVSISWSIHSLRFILLNRRCRRYDFVVTYLGDFQSSE